jgi:hypothetical protein
VRQLAIWVLVALALIFAHAIIVDPLGVWGTRIVPSTNYDVHGRARVSGDRIIKGIELTRGSYDTMIFGTSRLQSGIDPASKVFLPNNVYNAAIPSGRIAEQAKVIDTALALHPEITHAIWGIDYFVMISPERATADFDLSVFNGASALQGKLIRTFSFESLEGSLKFWREAAKGRPADMTIRGFHQQFSKMRGDARDFFLKLAPPEARRCHDKPDLDTIAANVRTIAETLQKLANRGVKVDIVFPPTHVWMQSMAERGGSLTVWEDIRTRISRHAERVGKTTPLPINVWDFDHPSAVTTEPLPQKGQASQWFYEISHGKPETGDLIMRVLYGTGKADVPPDFARQIRPHTATALFHVARNDLALWRENNQSESRMVDDFLKDAGCRVSWPE